MSRSSTNRTENVQKNEFCSAPLLLLYNLQHNRRSGCHTRPLHVAVGERQGSGIQREQTAGIRSGLREAGEDHRIFCGAE